MAPLLTIEEALQAVLERAGRLPLERVALEQAEGRFLGEPARAAVDLPPFASSAMDGFALRSEDVPAVLPVVAEIAAGRPAERPLEQGQAMAIATGGAVPAGADAVIPVELVVVGDNSVEVPVEVPAGANVREQGGDARAGEVVVPEGHRLGPAQIGALAAAGVAEVSCARGPRAVVVATGSELRSPGEALAPGEIYEANSLLLGAALERVGVTAERFPAVEDDEDAHREAVARGLEADLLVTTGGVSVGPHDLVRRIEAELGVEEVFWGVAVKPGKPISFGVHGGTLVFGLPGNPVSSLVGFELFVRPAVLALQGAGSPQPVYEDGRLERAVQRDDRRDQLVRARRQGDLLEPLSGQESHMIVRAAGADALVLVPRGEGELVAGASVRYLRLP